MKNFILCILTGSLFLLSAGAQAQSKKVYFCSDYTPSGEPVGVSSVWTITSAGGNVYMLYQNGGANITTATIYVYIDKLSGGTYKEYATKSVIPDKYKNWLIYDYTFYEAGEYKITFLDAAKATLATEYCTIKFKEGSEVAVTKTSGVTSDHYASSKVMFCESVTKDGDPITRSDVFNIGYNGGFVEVLVKNPKAMKTTELIVDIWKGDNYAEFVETKRFSVDESWAWTNFQYTFVTPGKYKFSVYNKEETFINTGYVTINRK